MLIPGEWYNLEHQTGVLVRGDSLLVMAAGRPPVILDALGSVTGALAMGRPSDMHIETVSAEVDVFGVARAHMMVNRGDWVASLELAGAGWHGRARHGALAPTLDRSGFGVSAPLLVEDRAQGGLLSLSGALLPSNSIGSRQRVSLYVEIYGAEESEVFNVRLSVTQGSSRTGLLTRIGRTLGLWGRPDGPVGLSWQVGAQVVEPGVAPFHLSIDTRSMESGTYRLEVEVRRADGTIAVGSMQMGVDR
jgi:hypothetical protein